MEERFVAFLDVLGFRSLVAKVEAGDSALFARIKRSLEAILEHEESIYEPISRALGSRTREMTAFSDSVVISDTIDNHFSVILSARSLYIGLLRDGILSRGAVLRGPLYHDRRIAFGPGLITAYEAETSAAVYPRIVVVDEIRRRMLQADSEHGLNIKFASMLSQDADGLWFIDPFSYPWPFADPLDEDDPLGAPARYFRPVRDHIGQGLQESETLSPNKLGLIAKWRWLAGRFNHATELRDIGAPISLGK